MAAPTTAASATPAIPATPDATGTTTSPDTGAVTPAQIRRRLEAIAPRLNQGHPERDRAGAFPRQAWRDLASTGLFGSCLPAEHGGHGHGVTDLMRSAETLGRVSRDAGLNFSAATHLASTGFALTRFGGPGLRSRHLPGVATGAAVGSHAITEPDTGSDVLSMSSTGRVDGDAIVLDGHKTYVTNGPVADLAVVYVRTGDTPGPLGLTAVLVPRGTPGAEFGPPIEKNTLRTSPFGTLRLTGCRVPRANVVGGIGTGFLVLDHVMTWEILVSFVINVGEMRHRLDRVVERVRTRRQFGNPLSRFQGVQNSVVDMHIAIETARQALYTAGEAVAAGRRPTAETAVAKILASEANVRTAQAAVELFGGSGVLTETGLEIGVRDALGGPVYSGTNAVQRQKIARTLGL
ncbi:acyl-CoA dehydrogenase family protein [Nocardiopsis sp. CT-R113]|uniref:Acyl-CoA dehydrogenase family protein n=1 Tax=Nocardiopsis codii TaxID=3065942 RepID=A0ABU7KB22_9ACTN|nr:acyl-CoA dehydrogenase family protein [Nocardiopsis sp. CT-R113]MEE2039436.1 acyl-CoA dehydrogenase family protein [Nocardiopsis sp. CT-R113]